MHGSPPCAITVARFVAWRVAVGTVALAALASLAAWLAGSPLGGSAWVRSGVAVSALVTLGLAVSLWRQPAVRLRWDGFVWSVAAAAADAAPERAGRLEVAIDLGSFLLLRFIPAAESRSAAVCWIAVGRAGLEREWHAFRCAVSSPQPAAGPANSDLRQP
ncbi:MAG: hypothetical protein ABIQ06_00845 [Caldimonas sp.]